jgi:hypothetical protein
MERVGPPPLGIPSGEGRFCPPPSAQGRLVAVAGLGRRVS